MGTGLVDLRSGEGKPVVAAFLALFGVTAAHTMIETARDALFLGKLPATQLPWMILGVAAVSLGIARVTARSGGKRRGAIGLAPELAVSAVVCVAFWALAADPSRLVLYALYLWGGLFGGWVILSYWVQLGGAFTVAQAKRLYGFIGAGAVLGAVAGSAVARLIAAIAPARTLLLGAAFALVITALGPGALFARWAPADEAAPPPRRAGLGAAPAGDGNELRRHPYLRLLVALAFFSSVALTWADLTFKTSAAAHVPKAELAAYFATVGLVLNALAFVVQLALVGWLLRVFGVHRAIWVLPSLLAAGAASVALGGQLAGAQAMRTADGALRHSLHKTTAELLLLPLPDRLRARAKPLVDVLGQRGGQTIAALTILALGALATSERLLGLLAALATVVWLGVAARIARPYADVFRAALSEGRIDAHADLPALDLAALEAVFAALNSQKDPEVLGALDLLAAQSRLRLVPALILYHPSRAVVLRALDLLASEEREDFIPIAARLIEGTDVDVAAAALQAAARASRDDALLRSHIDDPRPEVRATALVGLMARRSATDAEAPVFDDGPEARLRELVQDPSAAVRAALARAIAEDPQPVFGDLLLVMPHAEPEVANPAASAMGRLGEARFIEPLIARMPARPSRHAVRQALVAIGPKALERLDRALADRAFSREIRWMLPRAIGAFPGAIAAPILVRHLASQHEGIVRFRILSELARARRQHPELVLDDAVLRKVADETCETAQRLLRDRVGLSLGMKDDPQRATPTAKLLVTLLTDKEQHALGRVLLVLGLLRPEEDFSSIARGLASPNAKTRAQSRELCEHVMPPDLRGRLMPLLDELPDAERLARTERAPDTRDYRAIVSELSERGGGLALLGRHHLAELDSEAGAASIRVHIEPSELAAGLAAGAMEVAHG